MADTGFTDQDDWRQDKDNVVQRETLYRLPNNDVHDLEEPTGYNAFAQSDSAHREENNCPRKLFKVILIIGVNI